MSHRIQITLEDHLWEFVQTIPKNKRSQFLKQTVSDQLTRIRRQQAMEEMDILRSKLKPLPGCAEEWIREERDGLL